ncbi:OCTL-like protein [Mya arenaria]|uniref:OCTL-like protein n=1 Tax=Mya arenaria TaxID=6604 RepID=A0ABY7EWE8_MYAAR|nr:organic cation transporter protein-like [Mya arenaria]XP_052815913.1 organic cation transporter protein-like [Mya arenaria]WAR12739.1 OCTL-like protein [Mya arenaria]
MGRRRNLEDIDVDHIWNVLNPWGRYQWKQLSSYLFICVSWVIHQLSIVFIGYRPNFYCTPGPNDSMIANETGIKFEYEECSIKTFENTSDGEKETSTDCKYGFTYDIPTEQSFVSEWDFVCDKAEMAEATQTLLILGMMIGTFICPTLSDKFGRKPVMVFSHVILFAIVLGTAFSPNYTVFVVLRILTGAVTQGALSGTTLALETFPKEIRHNTEVLALAMWTTAICLMSPIAYALRFVSWRYLQITYALMSAWSVFQWWMLDESLRWVIANGKLDHAKRIVKNACKWNHKNYEDVLRQIGLDESEDETQELTHENGATETNGKLVKTSTIGNKIKEEMAVEQLNVTVIFRHKGIRNVSFIIWYTWMVDSLVYYGLYMISGDLYGDRYINFFLSALIEYPAAVFEYFALARIGRKWTCVICHSVAAVALIIATALTYSADGNTNMLMAGTAFTLVGKMGITGAFSSSYVVTPELYPTNLRNTGLGVGSFMGKIGGMIAPFSRNASHRIKWLPGAIYAVLCLVVIVLFAFVPETNGVELPQTLDELSEWYRVNKFELKIGKNRVADNAAKKGEHEINITSEKN